MEYLYATCFVECKINIESTERKTAFQNLYKPKKSRSWPPTIYHHNIKFFPENFKPSIIILGTCNTMSVYFITAVTVFLILVT